MILGLSEFGFWNSRIISSGKKTPLSFNTSLGLDLKLSLKDLSIHILAKTLPKISGKYFLTSSLFFKNKSLSTNSRAWFILLVLNYNPSTEIVKRYRVVLHRDFKKEDIPKLLAGTKYEGDFLKAEKVIPAPLEGEGHKRRLEVHLHHGKKREVRRLFEANRYYIKKLVRVQIGGIILKNLPRSGIRILGKKDIERLFTWGKKY